MIARPPPTDDLVRRYRESFEEVERVLSLHEGFVLQPLECVDAAIARALGVFLEAHGWQTRWLSTEGTAGARVLDQLLEVRLGTDARPLAVILFGPERPPPVLLEGIGAINRKRDAVIATLRCPLLWCGPPGFHVASWGAMPDFWSVRALTMSLKGEAPRGSSPGDFRPSRWSRFHDGEALRLGELESLRDASAAGGRLVDAARFSARVALARASTGAIAEALASLDASLARLEITGAGTLLASYGRTNPLRREVRPARARLLVALGALSAARTELGDDPRAADTAEGRYVTQLLNVVTGRPVPFTEAGAAEVENRFGRLWGGYLLAALGERNAEGGNAHDATLWLERAIETLARAGDSASASLAAKVLARVHQAQDRSLAALESHRESVSRATVRTPSRSSDAALTADQLRTLRSALATLYPARASIRRVFAEVGLPIERINLEGTALDVWSAALKEAQRSGQVADLLQIANDEYPMNEELRALRQALDSSTPRG